MFICYQYGTGENMSAKDFHYRFLCRLTVCQIFGNYMRPICRNSDRHLISGVTARFLSVIEPNDLIASYRDHCFIVVYDSGQNDVVLDLR